uniref:BHLH domain-containing protein n=1 Tax=Fagus sylvatica TaxID=28930 RepID=A0A2N9EPS5_FAGSY
MDFTPTQTPPAPEFHPHPPNPRVIPTRSQPDSSHSSELELKDCLSARKSLKADREKLRRDRQNEHFVELGNVVDPNRPRNDKATILADTIQLLKDMTSQINKLQSEHATLSEESCELTQEKNDLREEKASLKSDIDNLNVQYQQRVRAMFPWAAMDHSVVIAQPSYPYPVAMPMPPGPIPMHPSMQPYAFYGNHNPGAMHPHVLDKQDSRNKSSGESKIEKKDDSNDVTTDLELKTPGSTEDQDLSSAQRKSKKSWRTENNVTEESSSSRCSSSSSVKDSSSNSIIGGGKVDD